MRTLRFTHYCSAGTLPQRSFVAQQLYSVSAQDKCVSAQPTSCSFACSCTHNSTHAFEPHLNRAPDMHMSQPHPRCRETETRLILYVYRVDRIPHIAIPNPHCASQCRSPPRATSCTLPGKVQELLSSFRQQGRPGEVKNPSSSATNALISLYVYHVNYSCASSPCPKL